MSFAIKTEGFRELDEALKEFSKASARNVMRRAALEAIEPMADEMRALAPERDAGGGLLKESVGIGFKLGKRQKRVQKRQGSNDFVEVFAGVADINGNHLPSGVQQEFGNEHHDPQPFARPAFEKEARGTLQRLKEALTREVDKAVARAQRKAARAAAKAAAGTTP